MAFGDEMKSWLLKATTKNDDVFKGAGEEVLRSITDGSEITGAPGQPVGQYGPGYNPGKVGGTLKASWQRWFETPTLQVIATDAPHAPQEEDGISYAHGGTPITQRSSVGGFHSLKQTVAAWQPIVDAVATRVVGS
jgi:hypothetical protein